MSSKTFPFENEDVFIVEGEAKTSDNRSEKNYQPLKRYRVKNNTLIMEKDFIKHGKNATKKDYDRVSKLSLDKIIQWSVEYAINRGKDNTTSFADYEAYTNEFRKRFRYFYSVESFCYDKNDNGKMAAVPKILCDQNFPVEDHIKELELLLPYFSYINWSDEINEAIQISIFEENLSYNGIYLAYIKKDGKGKRYDCIVGYSGHEYNVEPTVYACVLGAKIIERHITLDHTMWGTDQSSSLEVGAMYLLNRRVQHIDMMLGSGIKQISVSERKIINKLKHKLCERRK